MKQRITVKLEVELEVDTSAWATEYGLTEDEAGNDARTYMRAYILDALTDSYAVRSELVCKVGLI